MSSNTRRRSRPYRRRLASVAKNVTNKKVVLRTITEMDDEDGSYCSAGATSDPIETLDVWRLEAALGAIDAGDLHDLAHMKGVLVFLTALLPLRGYGLGTLDADAVRTEFFAVLESDEDTGTDFDERAARAAINAAINVMGHVRGTGKANVKAVITAMMRYQMAAQEAAEQPPMAEVFHRDEEDKNSDGNLRAGRETPMSLSAGDHTAISSVGYNFDQDAWFPIVPAVAAPVAEQEDVVAAGANQEEDVAAEAEQDVDEDAVKQMEE